MHVLVSTDKSVKKCTWMYLCARTRAFVREKKKEKENQNGKYTQKLSFFAYIVHSLS